MLNSAFINKLRIAVGDLALLTQDKWSGDGSTVAFRASEKPIKDGAYQVYVEDILQTETTNYTLNRDTGLLEFVSAPEAGTKNIKMDYQYFFMRDEDWIDIIGDVLDEWRRKIWAEAYDESSMDSVADADEYDMDDIDENIIWVVNIYFKKSTDIEWVALGRDQNWEYKPEQNKVIVRPSFSSADYDLRVYYLKAYTKGTAVADDFEPATKFHPPIQSMCESRFWYRFAAYKLKDTGALTKEMSFHPAKEILNLAQALEKRAYQQLALVKPVYPTVPLRLPIDGITT